MDNAVKKEDLYTEEEYYAMELPVRTELIDWRIYYLASPSTQHQDISMSLSIEIGSYIKRNKGKCKVFGAPCDVKLRDGLIVQPDVFVTCDRDKIGKQYLNGAPEWVVEIVSPGNSMHDYEDKFWLYKNSGVKEYWIIDPSRERVLVYLFGENETMKTYTFTDIITVDLYKQAEEPLKLCIKGLEY